MFSRLLLFSQQALVAFCLFFNLVQTRICGGGLLVFKGMCEYIAKWQPTYCDY